ncbi:MAG: hypothetical protein V1859_02860 [archaeon]
MKKIVFDTGPLITFALNNLYFTLERLKEFYPGDFVITPSVVQEAIDKPLESKRFKLEALQLLKLVRGGIIVKEEYPELKDETNNLLMLANSIFKAQDNYIKIVHYGETESLCHALHVEAEALVIDEYVTRTIVENPMTLKKRLERKLHQHIEVEKSRLNEFNRITKKMKIIRSVELLTVAFELGLLDDYKLLPKNPGKNLLDAILWGAKLNGCSVSEEEIGRIIKAERL